MDTPSLQILRPTKSDTTVLIVVTHAKQRYVQSLDLTHLAAFDDTAKSIRAKVEEAAQLLLRSVHEKEDWIRRALRQPPIACGRVLIHLQSLTSAEIRYYYTWQGICYERSLGFTAPIHHLEFLDENGLSAYGQATLRDLVDAEIVEFIRRQHVPMDVITRYLASLPREKEDLAQRLAHVCLKQGWIPD